MSDRSTSSGDSLEVHVWRGCDDGSFQVYDVPAAVNQTILDVVTWIQRHREPALAYRYACRVGVCGSCAMTVNGRPRWTCRSHVDDVVDGCRIVIEPLRHLPRVKDLVTDLAPFFDKWTAVGGSFDGTSTRNDKFALVEPDSEQRQAADAGIECINCAVCYSACDVVGWRPDYQGPAALNRAWTLVNDVRHATRDEILDNVAARDGCLSCHTHGSCTELCPIGISPTAAISGLKRLALRRWLPSARK